MTLSMLVLRSLLFNLAFYVNIVLWMILALPTLLMPRPALLWIVRSWARVNIFLMRHIADITCEIRGRENLPPGPVLVRTAGRCCRSALAPASHPGSVRTG